MRYGLHRPKFVQSSQGKIISGQLFTNEIRFRLVKTNKTVSHRISSIKLKLVNVVQNAYKKDTELKQMLIVISLLFPENSRYQYIEA